MTKVRWIVGANCTGKTQIARGMLGCSLLPNSIYYGDEPRSCAGRVVEFVLHGNRVRVFTEGSVKKVDALLKRVGKVGFVQMCCDLFRLNSCKVWVTRIRSVGEFLKTMDEIATWNAKMVFVEGLPRALFVQLENQLKFPPKATVYIECAVSGIEEPVISDAWRW